MHVLRAWIRSVDPARGRARVPLVDRGVVLHAGISALPSRLGYLAHQLAGPDGLDGLAGQDRLELPVLVLLVGLHEPVVDADRVVRVLVLDRVAVPAVEVHIEPGIAQGARLALLNRLAPDEALNVRVVDVEDDHLGGAARLAPGLDRPGRGVGAAHEAHRPGGRAAAAERLLRAADLGQVDPRSRSAFEDGPLLHVPVEDRGHRVVDGEDEARAALLGCVWHADVEPGRRVERRLLVHEEVAELLREDLGVLVVREVAVLPTPPRDRVDDPTDELADAGLSLRRSEGPAEVLLRDDVRGVLRPRLGELDVALLEGVPSRLVVRDDRVTTLPIDLIERMHAVLREEPLERQAVPDDPDVPLFRRQREPPFPTGGEDRVDNYRPVILSPPAVGVKLAPRISCGSARRPPLDVAVTVNGGAAALESTTLSSACPRHGQRMCPHPKIWWTHLPYVPHLGSVKRAIARGRDASVAARRRSVEDPGSDPRPPRPSRASRGADGYELVGTSSTCPGTSALVSRWFAARIASTAGRGS